MAPETASQLAAITKKGINPADLKSGNRDILSVGDHLEIPQISYPPSAASVRAAEIPQSPAEQRAAEGARNMFPNEADSHYRTLTQKDLLTESGGPSLSPEDAADLHSKMLFPAEADSRYRQLARAELLSETGGAKLSPEDAADLHSKMQFPAEADSRYRALARREILSESGGPPLSLAEAEILHTAIARHLPWSHSWGPRHLNPYNR